MRAFLQRAGIAIEETEMETSAAAAVSTSVRVSEHTRRCDNGAEHRMFCPTFLRDEDRKRFKTDNTERCRDARAECTSPELPWEGAPFTPSTFFDTFVRVSQETMNAQRTIPQGDARWIEVRRLIITASQFAKAIARGYDGESGPIALVVSKLWGDNFDDESKLAMEWGTVHEDHGRARYEEIALDDLRARYAAYGLDPEDAWLRTYTSGIIRFEDQAFMGVSPDFFCEYRDVDGTVRTRLGEIKCPYYLFGRRTHPYAKHEKNTPVYYYDQIQGIAGLLKSHGWDLEGIDFVVWQPHQTWITRHDIDDDHYNRVLLPGLVKWYTEMFLPALAWRANGMLFRGEIRPRLEVDIE